MNWLIMDLTALINVTLTIDAQLLHVYRFTVGLIETILLCNINTVIIIVLKPTSGVLDTCKPQINGCIGAIWPPTL